MENMFCFQCEQTAGCTGCTGDAGVCGKPSDVAAAQDRLTGALISWAAGLEGTPSEEAAALAIECLFACITNVDFSRDAIESLIARVHGQMDAAGIATDADYDMWRIWEADEDIRSLKSLLLFGIRGTAAYAYHARVLGFIDD
ncbi:MAG: hydroxylamine reductase, partial [Coriobacteriales bacterium]|nr:hydroxylamine reductase [Coriobacteriales bacterium]